MSKDKILITEELVEVNGKRYLPENSINKSPNYSGDIKIVILQRGWIYIGRFSKSGNTCKLENAYNIREWGTTQGLGQLVNGPTSSTKIDKCEGIVEFDWLTVIHTISVKEEKWNLI